jgi:hypothetical protein
MMSYAFNTCHIGQIINVTCELKRREHSGIILEISLRLCMQHLCFQTIGDDYNVFTVGIIGLGPYVILNNL